MNPLNSTWSQTEIKIFPQSNPPNDRSSFNGNQQEFIRRIPDFIEDSFDQLLLHWTPCDAQCKNCSNQTQERTNLPK
jgi:hypothetical protein